MPPRLAFALAAALVLAACHPKPQAGVKIDPALSVMTPETAVALVGVRMEAIRKTAIYQRLSASRSLPELDDFARETGLDPRTDLWEFLFVCEPSGWVAMARGKFSPGFGGLEPRLREGAPRTRYKGYSIIGDERASTVFVNSSTAIAGSGRAVRAILGRRNESRGIPPALDEQIRGLPPAAQIWAVWSAPADALPLPREGNWANLARIAALVHGGALSVELQNEAVLSAAASCASEQDARTLNDTLRGLAGLGRLATPADRPELLSLYDSLRISHSGNEARLSAVVSAGVVERLIPMIR